MTRNSSANAFHSGSSRPASANDRRAGYWLGSLTAARNASLRDRSIRRALLAFAAAAAPLLLFHNAAAIPIKITDKNSQLLATADTCSGGGMKFKNCTSTAFLNNTSIDGTDPDFSNEFNAWNDTNPKGSKWTLANGGALPGGMIEVSVFKAIANNKVGGLSITMSWPFNGDKSGFSWTQGLI